MRSQKSNLYSSLLGPHSSLFSHAHRRSRRQPERRQIDAVQRALRAAPAGRQLPRRHRRDEEGAVHRRRHDHRPHRPARHVQPRRAQPGRDGRGRSAARPPAGRTAARRRRLHRRRHQPRPPPLPHEPVARPGRAGRRRGQHDRRGRGAGTHHRLREAVRGARACRSCRFRRTTAPGWTNSRRRFAPRRSGGAVPRGPAFPAAFDEVAEQLRKELERRTADVPDSPRCSSTSAGTRSSGSSGGTATG